MADEMPVGLYAEVYTDRETMNRLAEVFGTSSKIVYGERTFRCVLVKVEPASLHRVVLEGLEIKNVYVSVQELPEELSRHLPQA